MVEYHLGQGDDPNFVIDASGLPAIHFSCQSTAGIFKYLLESGRSIFNRDSDGASVIDYTLYTTNLTTQSQPLMSPEYLITLSKNEGITLDATIFQECGVHHLALWLVVRISIRLHRANAYL